MKIKTSKSYVKIFDLKVSMNNWISGVQCGSYIKML